ncbi:Biopolymer transport protein ExbD/TolR family protein [uncultured Paludibacter sp.]|uniref:Biopolymer transport protein ExbD/TolR family protein n=1 Tax=uncultured Paludibacter sp. TaxID=497635 RepID=A0A653AES6_9BACT|nr:Biopolymer transport protein ExbD/TolR family protein [uncultured Paludibacter sp.]
MPKIKVKRKSTFIDMTAMSDVTVLLLTFFMLTSTFLKKEPVQVKTPGSVSEIKIPEQNVLSILISPKGQVFLDLDKPEDRIAVLEKMAAEYDVALTDKEKKDFSIGTSFGVPMANFKQFMALKSEEQDKILMNYGVPTDSTDNQFKGWVKFAREVKGKDMVIAIKSDQDTPYSSIKNVMNTLLDLDENRYNLITSLRELKEEK